jgi:Signal transduction histidine kinase
VLALAFVSAALLIGIFDAQIFRARAERIQREKDDLNRMAQIVEADANNIFSRLKFFFQAADLWLANHPSADPRFDPSFRELVDAFRSSLDNRVDIRLVSESGGLFYIPSKDSKPLADVSDRAYYKAQMDPATRGLFVADPVKSRVTQLWGIPISYPLASRNGGIAVIFAAIEEPTILELYEAVRPKPGGSITLLRKDGIILARAPFDEALIGKPISPDLAAWRRAMQDSPSGSFESRVATTDNSVRLVAYKADLEDGFVVSVSAKKDDVLAEWNAAAIWQGVILVLVLALGAFLFTRLFGALHRLDEVHAELRRNLERARRSDATKDKLFSVIAHDLRGPIGGMASLLDGMEIDRRSISDEEMGRFISVLRDTSWNTSQLLENLLAWSRDQRSEMAFRPERLYLLPLVRECEEIFSLSASGKGVAIELGIPAELEAYADPDQLRILVRNLLSNAVKFTPRGKKVLASASGVEGGIEIVVRDEGIGMDEEQRRALFDLSATRSRSGTENERGSGLGLVLCKSIVDRHGGRIEVESEPGSGSAFTVFLPAGKEE